jgi:hypothetical protein
MTLFHQAFRLLLLVFMYPRLAQSVFNRINPPVYPRVLEWGVPFIISGAVFLLLVSLLWQIQRKTVIPENRLLLSELNGILDYCALFVILIMYI